MQIHNLNFIELATRLARDSKLNFNYLQPTICYKLRRSLDYTRAQASAVGVRTYRRNVIEKYPEDYGFG